MTLPYIKVAVLGDTGTGKSSFLRRFKTNDFDDATLPDWRNRRREFGPRKAAKHSVGAVVARPTKPSAGFPNLLSYQAEEWDKKKCSSMFCTVFMSRGKGGNKEIDSSEMVDLSFLDAPSFPRFPLNSLQEWDEEGAVGVRSADVYIILYDVTNRESFRYARTMKEGILASFAPSVPNMRRSALSKVLRSSFSRNSNAFRPFEESETARSSADSYFRRMFARLGHLGSRNYDNRRTSVQSGLLGVIPSVFFHSLVPMTIAEETEADLGQKKKPYPPTIMIVANKCDLLTPSCGKCPSVDQCGLRADNQVNPINHEVAQLVRKSWKCLFMECSVKSGWNLTNVVKEAVDIALDAQEQTERKTQKRSRQSK